MTPHALRIAVATGGLRLSHQPIIDLRTGRVAGTEAFLRVADPDADPRPLLREVDDPDLLAEVAGWVLGQALTTVREWDDAGIGPLDVWCNLSGPELRADGLAARVAEALARHRVEAERVHLEVPETSLLPIDEHDLDALRDLSRLGLRLGIDDYGTGAAPLELLRSLPMHYLKVAPSIGRRVHEPGGLAVVDGVVSIGRALGFDVIAEGVEDRTHLATLARLGCTHAQGHLLASPSSIDDLVVDARALPVFASGAADLDGPADASAPWPSNHRS